MSTPNPLNTPGQIFDFDFRHPNPKSRKSKDGPVYKLEIEIDQDTWQLFMDADTTGMVIAAKACVVGDEADHVEPQKPKSAKGPYSQQAYALEKAGFFHAPPLHRVVGTDAQYLEWLRGQSCAVCGAQAPSEAAHVRRINQGSGTGIKPPYSAIPLCNHCHHAQHEQGESAIGGKEQVDKYAAAYLRLWARERFKEFFGVESMTQLNPGEVWEWAGRYGLTHLLPRDYYER